METEDVSPALRERLGAEATTGLLDLFNVARQGQEWTADVTTAAVERFERRLGEELGSLRTEIRAEFAALRTAMTENMAALRLEMRDGDAALRLEMRAGDASLRQEMRDGDASLRQEMRDLRFEMLRWCFTFWVGQFVVMAGIVGIVVRLVR